MGALGSQHARLYAELAKRAPTEVQFIGACDPDDLKVRAVAEKTGSGAFRTVEEICQFVDAVSVATPADTHFAVARPFLESGKHVLIEKPITDDVAAAAELVRTTPRLRRAGRTTRSCGARRRLERCGGARVSTPQTTSAAKTPRALCRTWPPPDTASGARLTTGRWDRA